MDLFSTITALLGVSWTERKFRANFGISSLSASVLWSFLLSLSIDLPLQPVYMLWTLYFLKVYDTVDVMAGRFHCDVATFSHWTWHILFLLYSSLDTVNIHIY